MNCTGLGPCVPVPVYTATKAGLLMYSRTIAVRRFVCLCVCLVFLLFECFGGGGGDGGGGGGGGVGGGSFIGSFSVCLFSSYSSFIDTCLCLLSSFDFFPVTFSTSFETIFVYNLSDTTPSSVRISFFCANVNIL